MLSQHHSSTPQPPTSDPGPHKPAWKRYIAIGDSFTEGLWDPDETSGPTRGWADRLAEYLGVDEYANLAIRGRLLESIVTQQLPAALAMEPDLISIVGGGNDLLRPGNNPDRLARMLEYATVTARKQGADVLLVTAADTRNAGLLSATRNPAALATASIWSIARRHGAYVVDQWGLRAIQDWRMWAPDRIHLNSQGHHRVANAAMVALGLPAPDPDYHIPLEPQEDQTWVSRMAGEARWIRHDVYPWLTRRLRRTSSGTDREPKRPNLGPLL